MIHRKANGKYQVNMLDEYGKRTKRTFPKKGDAAAFAAMIHKAKYDNKLVKNNLARSRYLMSEALNDFRLSKQDLRPSSIKKYLGVINELDKFMISQNITFVDEFSADHSTKLFNLLVKERLVNEHRTVKPKPKTVNFYLQTLRAFFQQEFKKDHIQKDPIIHLKNLRVEKASPEFYTKDELKLFFEQPMHTAYKQVFLGLLYTGMRFSELANLHWSDVDLVGGYIKIQSNQKFKTKTYNSQRTIPMTSNLKKLLEEMAENKTAENFVFTSPEGKMLRERRLLEICKKVAREAGLTSRAFIHKFRHSYASHLLQSGVQLESIKELLGHSSITETEIYAHNAPDHLHSHVDKINNLIEL
jgi:site-specific recombinase XerD